MIFFKLAVRNMLRQKFSFLVNVFGLALGIGSFLLISFYVYDETRYDLFHEKGERIFRLTGNLFNPNSTMALMPLLFYPVIVDNVPEVEQLVRVQAPSRPPDLSYGEQSIGSPDILFADPEIFQIFSFALTSGSADAFADDHNGIIIDAGLAEKLFGDEPPVGKVIRYGSHNLTVRGVMEKVPRHSHLQFSALIHFEYLRPVNAFAFETWGNYSTVFYALLRSDADIPAVENRLLDLFVEARGFAPADDSQHFRLQPLFNVYLGSDGIGSGTVPILTGNSTAIRIFALSAVLILLLACFNYVNLSTARSTGRAREVGVRKVLGANKNTLVRNFLGESLLISIAAMLLALVLVELSLPYFSSLSGKTLSFSSMPPGLLALYLMAIVAGVALLAGLYPSLLISGFDPVAVLKGSPALIGRSLQGRSGPAFRFRQLLIILQFAISIGLVISTLVMYQQTRHALRQSGFDMESLVVVRNVTDAQITQRYHAMRTQLEQHPFIAQISAGTHVPTQHLGLMSQLRQPHQPREEAKLIYLTYVDFGYFETLGVPVASGRSFDVRMHTDSTDAVILNRSAANELGIAEADGSAMLNMGGNGTKRVIGIVEDIHFRSVSEKVRPKAFYINHVHQYQPPAGLQLLIRFNTGSIARVMEAINAAWAEHAPEGADLEYFFMDAQYENLYREELQTGKVARIFTVLAILIAAMGLLGTTIYVMEARKKEFGIRKVLGASTLRLSHMVSKEFGLLVVLANLIAWPLTFYFMSNWLDHFAYRIELTIWVFISAGLLGLLLALVIVNSLALRQAGKNPVESIKYE